MKDCTFGNADELEITYSSNVSWLISSPSDSRASTYDIEHVLRCFNKLICAQTSDLSTRHEIVCWFLALCAFDGRFSQLLPQLVSRDEWTGDLDEILSNPFVYIMAELFFKARNHKDLFPSQELATGAKIAKFLGSKSSVLKIFYLESTTGLMQSCLLERTIMIGSFVFCHSTYAEGLQYYFKKLMIQNLTILLNHGHCPRETVGGSYKIPWLKSYSPTKIARDLGVLEIWSEALVQSGHDASDIIDESLYTGLIELFDGLPYQYSETDEKGEEDNNNNNDNGNDRQKSGLVGKAARMALAFTGSII